MFEKLFGFRFREPEKKSETTPPIAPPINEDGALVIEAGTAGTYNVVYDVDGIINNEIELINKYRDISLYPECAQAIDEIVNDFVIADKTEPPVSLIIGDSLNFSDKLKEKIENEFQNVLRLLNFNFQAYELVRRWYIDGKLYYQVIIDKAAPEKGIQEVRYLDPRCIKKVRETTKERDQANNIDIYPSEKEYFLFNPLGVQQQQNNNRQGIRISDDSIVYCHSGLLNKDYSIILSYLYYALKPYNNLRAMEDSLVIYRITRSTEKRVFNIDVGEQSPAKAKAYMQQIMDDYRTKLQYNAESGEIRDDRRHATILEDFWFPKRGDGRSSDVSVLAGGDHLDAIQDIEYFQKKLFKSLCVPTTRLDPEKGFSLGKAAEISREEVKFSKYITRLRFGFSHLFDELLKRQLILKKITTEADWEYIRENLFYDFISDSYFAELKQIEIMNERLDLLDKAVNYMPEDDKVFFSKEYLRDNVLQLTEAEIEGIEEDLGKGKEEPPVEDQESPEDTVPEDDAPDFEDKPERSSLGKGLGVGEPVGEPEDAEPKPSSPPEPQES